MDRRRHPLKGLSDDGHVILRRVIPRADIQAAMRAINCHMWAHGLNREQVTEYSRTACWFPELCEPDHPWHPYLARLLAPFLAEAGEVWTQIVLQFPDFPGAAPRQAAFHVDEPPADGRRFRLVVCVALTRTSHARGGLTFRDETVELEPGDAVAFGGEAEHNGGVNTSGEIRYAVYFRFVE